MRREQSVDLSRPPAPKDRAYDSAVDDSDRQDMMSPRTILYIWEGNHTCLVLAKQLLQGWLKWEPLPAIWVIPRP
jgi:hypothetical protein